MNIEDSQFLLDLRQRVLANVAAGRPAKTGVSDEENRRFLALLRPARTAAVSTKPASASKKAVSPMSDADVDALFGGGL